MAPHGLPMDMSMDLSETIGTWCGTLLTGVGLLAVFTQLRAFIGSRYAYQERLLKRQAGDWNKIFGKDAYAGEGLMAQAAPSYAAWIYKKYKEAASARLTQYDARDAGTSSWSRIFAQSSVWPEELVQPWDGELSRKDPTFQRAWMPVNADIWKRDGKLMYGFSSAEFCALLIIGGFSPDHMNEPGPGNSVCYLGTTYLADLDAFSQQVQLDPHTGRANVPPKTGRHLHDIPVQESLHLALGMLKMHPQRGSRTWLIFPNPIHSNDEANTHLPGSSPDFDPWTTLPKTVQLNRLSLNMEMFTHITIGHIFNYTTTSLESASAETTLMRDLVCIKPKTDNHQYPLHRALLSAYAIDALIPWALLPVAPRHLVTPLQTLLSPFVGSREDTVEALSGMLRSLSTQSTSLKSFHPTDGWKDAEERIEAVQRSSNIRTDFFSQSADNCRYYYDTMADAFADNNLTFALVRRVLAARVAHMVLYPDDVAYGKVPFSAEKKDDSNQSKNEFLSRVVEHLQDGSSEDGSRTSLGPSDLESMDWAVKIYATYLWGWLGDSLDTSGDFLGMFRRRVFMG